jgi:CIC family chloride channel protein
LNAWPVVDESSVVGTVSLSRLQKALTEEATQQSLRGVLPAGEFPHVHMDHSLAMALDRMGSSQLDVLPVVNRANVHELEGIVTLQDVLRLYGVDPGETTAGSGEPTGLRHNTNPIPRNR